MVRLARLLVLAVLWAMPSIALAQGGSCGDEVERWVARCNAQHGTSIDAIECPAADLFVLGTPAVRVELVRGTTRGFRRVNGWGLSPVDVSDEWASVAADKRAAFEAVVACVERDGALPTIDTGVEQPSHTSPSQAGSSGSTPSRAPRRAPWRALLAAAALLAAWWPLRARRKEQALAAAVAVASVALVAVRMAVVRPAFFHQNGQGPLWIDAPLSPRAPYGTGFAELFGWAVRLFPAHPDAAVFCAQSTLAALAVCAAWGLARRSATSPEGRAPTAAALAACLLVNPTLARMANSESYFATCLSLELIAAWALTHAMPLRRGDPARRLRAVAPTVAAALLLSLSVAVHPIAWVPSAMVPLVLLVGPGSARHRVRRTLFAYAVVGVVVAATGLSGVLRVLHGELGQRWLPRGAAPSIYPGHVFAMLRPWLLGAVPLIALARRPMRALPRVALGLMVLAVIPMTDQAIMSATRPWITSAFAWLHAPVALAVLAATLSDVARARWQAWALAAVLALGGAGFAARHYREVTTLTTDALELRTLLAWRDRLPAGSTVVFLWRAGDHLLAFPLYPAIDPLRRRTLALDVRQAPPSLAGRNLYWYRSSLCATSQGRAYCDAVERRLTLDPVVSATFPARWSLRLVDYDRDPVPVGLYRVRSPAGR